MAKKHHLPAVILMLAAPVAAGDPSSFDAWNQEAVGADQAPASVGETKVLVAVLDTGVYPDARALRDATIHRGRNLLRPSRDAEDDNGHGTHIASLIAGRVGSSEPMCPECEILPVKVLDSRGLGDARTLASGLRWAVEQGADVVNMSMGFDPGYDPGPELAAAVEHARREGVVLVASVGNEGRPGVTYPAGYPGVIAVAAVDYDGARTPYSNLSPAVDLAAPGGDDRDRDGDGVPESILSDGLTLHGRGAEPWLYSGTSQAAAHVSALAARLVAAGVPPANVESLLGETARDLGPRGFDLGTGAGLVDFPSALRRARNLDREPLAPPWNDTWSWEARRVAPDTVEVRITGLSGESPDGVVLFGHWVGTDRVIVEQVDALGTIRLRLPGARVEQLAVDRIGRGASADGIDAFAIPGMRPYQGILASPLTRYSR